jgi:hypothetical protein
MFRVLATEMLKRGKPLGECKTAHIQRHDADSPDKTSRDMFRFCGSVSP